MPLDPKPLDKMGKLMRGASPDEKPPRVTSDDLKGGRISQKVFTDCIQHPATILPAAGSAGMVCWTFLFLNPWTIVPAVALAAVAAGAFVFNFGIQGEKRGLVRREEVRKQLLQQKLDDLNEVTAESQSLGFADAVTRSARLKEAFEQLLKYVEDHPGVVVDPGQVWDALDQGTRMLRKALEKFKAISSVDHDDLKGKLAQFKRELGTLDEKLAKNGPRIGTLKLAIEQYQQRIDILAGEQNRLDELLLHADEIEAALERNYLKLTSLHTGDGSIRDVDGGAIKELDTVVEAARRVEERHIGGLDAEKAASRREYMDSAGGDK